MLLPQKKQLLKIFASSFLYFSKEKRSVRYYFNSQSGQILIIFLLILVVGLAIALTIASTTVTDIRQTTTSDESNRAYFAAEAGVERALKSISENPDFATTTPETINFVDVNKSETKVSVTALNVPADRVFEIPGKVAKDDVVQVFLMSDFDSIASAGGAGSILAGHTLNFYWDESTSSTESHALEVSILQCIAPCSDSGVFQLSKMTFDPNSTRAGGNNFCSHPSVVSTGTYNKTTSLEESRAYKYRAILTLNNNSTCPNNDIVVGFPVLARLRLLYNPGVSVRLAVESPGVGLPIQGQKIESVGVTLSGVSRRLTVTKLYPSLPAIFDHVLYNGSLNSPITKP